VLDLVQEEEPRGSRGDRLAHIQQIQEVAERRAPQGDVVEAQHRHRARIAALVGQERRCDLVQHDALADPPRSEHDHAPAALAGPEQRLHLRQRVPRECRA
jgi:hypothetical protein